MARSGVRPLPTVEAVALFQEAVEREHPLVLPVALDPGRFSGPVPALLRGLVRTPVRAVAAPARSAAGLPEHLAALPARDAEQLLTEIVRSQAATVLGHPDPTGVAADRPFKDLGFDSLTGVELRNRLTNVTGVRLPVTVVFDHPTPAALARLLRGRLLPEQDVAARVANEIDRLADLLAEVAGDERARPGLTAKLRVLLAGWNGEDAAEPVPQDDGDLDSATDAELFALMDNKPWTA